MSPKRRQKKFFLTKLRLPVYAHVRLTICAALGLASCLVTGLFISWTYAPLVFWDTTALLILTSLWFLLRTFNPLQTEEYATREDPGRGVADVLLFTASCISLGAVVILLVQSSSSHGVFKSMQIALGLLSVLISWTTIHTLYMLRYADLYLKNKGGISFNSQDKPTYYDFAYLSFTIGMTYQVADTALTSPEFRRVVRNHALISYLFGTAIIATTINFVAGLGK